MYYTASSVEKALNANHNLSTKYSGSLGCLKPKPKATSLLKCYGGNPCERGYEHRCKRLLYVDDIKGKRLMKAVLKFTFTISKTDSDGYIEAENPQLNILIDEKLININFLKEAKIA